MQKVLMKTPLNLLSDKFADTSSDDQARRMRQESATWTDARRFIANVREIYAAPDTQRTDKAIWHRRNNARC